MISGCILSYAGTQTSKSLHWPMSDLTEQVTCWGNTFFFFPIKPGHSNAYLLTKQGATQLDFHKRAASLKNLCLCSERDGSKAKGWMKPKWFKPSYLASYTWQQHWQKVSWSPEVCQGKKAVSCSPFPFDIDTPLYTQKIRSVLVAHGCLRLDI